MNENLPSCFVIQCFDGGTYDRRYAETIAPALRQAGVEPQRADDILGLQPIITKIEVAISDAAICVAEVSTDNPNVWLELGYALALNRPCIILCDRAARPRLPFDIQHRPVILYRADSKSGFDELERELIKHLKNELQKDELIENSPVLMPGVLQTEGFQDYEVAILTMLLAVWPTPDSGLIHRELERRLEQLGFRDVAVGLGLDSLLKGGFVQSKETMEDDSFGNSYEKRVFQVTPKGIEWLQENKDKLQLREPEDDIPF